MVIGPVTELRQLTNEVQPKSDTSSPERDRTPYPPLGYAWYVVFILMICYVFSFVDRQILGLLVRPIKADLGITDTQMSYLMGFSFALFYTLFGIPMGRLADSKSRRTIIAIGLVVWSFMSAGCGLARRYVQLLAMRVGVGVGEATLSPAAYSLITDYFPPQRLGLAISVYGMGIYIGSGLAYMFGGWVIGLTSGQALYTLPLVGDVRSWQLVFFAIGLPGLLFASVLFTIKEPVRRGIGTARPKAGRGVPLASVLAYVRTNSITFMCHNVGFALIALVAYGSISWIPTYLGRVHGWAPADAGMRYGMVILVFGSTGILFGGILSDWMGRKGYTDSKMTTGFIAALAHIPLAIAYPLMPTGWSALGVIAVSVFILAMPFGVAPAAIQAMMPNAMRGQASAIYLFVVNLIGMGLGPTAVAVCTDSVFKDENMIHYSILVVGLAGSIAAAVLLWFGRGAYRQSLDRLQTWNEEQTKA